MHRLAGGVDPSVITTAEAAAGAVPGVQHAHARARWTGRTAQKTSTYPAPGSAHHQPRAAFSTNPASTGPVHFLPNGRSYEPPGGKPLVMPVQVNRPRRSSKYESELSLAAGHAQSCWGR